MSAASGVPNGSAVVEYAEQMLASPLITDGVSEYTEGVRDTLRRVLEIAGGLS